MKNDQPVIGQDIMSARLNLAAAGPAQSVLSQTVELNLPHTELDRKSRLWALIHHHSLKLMLIMIGLIGIIGIKVAASYLSPVLPAKLSQPVSRPNQSGINMAVPAASLNAEVAKLTNQPISLSVGNQTVNVPANTIKNWLSLTPSRDHDSYNIHVKATAMASSLTGLANQFVKAPVNQVSISHGGTAQVVVAGRNGLKLPDPGGLKDQATAGARSLLSAKGLQFNTPSSVVNFGLLTPANFNKLIEVNVVTKQMYLYDNGNLSSSYAISAGAPATPTPIGEFHIFEKLVSQTMTGFNANGTKYVQPNVPYINYFLPGGYAIHGNYWRPLSYFGVINSSHGCVSLPVNQAVAVYNWAPIGTTVITHI